MFNSLFRYEMIEPEIVYVSAERFNNIVERERYTDIKWCSCYDKKGKPHLIYLGKNGYEEYKIEEQE